MAQSIRLLNGPNLNLLGRREPSTHGAPTPAGTGLRAACRGVAIAYCEVRLSKVYRREEFRHRPLLADGAVGVIAGLGAAGYRLALQYAPSERRS